MNYEIYLDGVTPSILHKFSTVEAFRPRIGDIIQISTDPFNQYKVLRSEPTSNPTGQLVKYYVEKLDPFVVVPEYFSRNYYQINEPGIFTPKQTDLEYVESFIFP